MLLGTTRSILYVNITLPEHILVKKTAMFEQYKTN